MLPLLQFSKIIPLIFFLSLLCKFIRPDTQVYYIFHVCLGTGNYTQNSTYQSNLNLLLSTIPTKAPLTNFYNSTAGEGADKVYALFLCQGGITPQVCQTCVDSAIQNLLQKCPNQKEAIIWYEECMLRYSNRSIFSIEEEFPYACWRTGGSVSNPDQFNQALFNKLDELTTEAAYGSSAPIFATGEANISIFQTIYCLVQCTPDITGNDCNRCLRFSMNDIQNCSLGLSWGLMIFRPSCRLRYDKGPFYMVNATPPLQDLPNPGGKSSLLISLAVAVPVVTVVLLLSGIWFCLHRRKQEETPIKNVGEISTVESLQLDFGTIEAATENFSVTNKLGEGGFGTVYKGRLPSGQEIAVKRLSRNSRQGDAEFKTEVLLVARLQHKNLVKLLGFCLEGEEMLLVYEFVQNSSLDHFLFDKNKRALLDWGKRYKIIMGIARGLLYLHEDSRLKIIHRDLKSSNILLDEEMKPKIADFGMARLFKVDQTQGNTSRIVGTHGYMAPEYAMTGKFSVKSDVFSFGVILLEMVSGQKNSSFYQSELEEDLLRYTWKLWNEGTILELMDSTLHENFSRSEVMRCIHVGLLCIQEDAASRPSMASAFLMLNNNSETLPFPSAPAFFSHGTEMPTINDNSQSREKSNNWYPEKEQISDLFPR